MHDSGIREQREQQKRRRVAWMVLSCVLAVAWMGVIFWMSATAADESDGMSKGLIGRLLNLFAGWANPDLVAELNHPVRKLAHFTEYAILGLLLANVARAASALRESGTGGTGAAGFACAWLFGTLFAVSDEIHQRFVPGRSMQLSDMCIDSSGVLLGVLVFALVAWLVARKRGSNA